MEPQRGLLAVLPASESPLDAGALANADALVVANAALTDGLGASALGVLEVLELPLTLAEGGAGGGGEVTLLRVDDTTPAVLPPAVIDGAVAVALMLGAVAVTGGGGLPACTAVRLLLGPEAAMLVGIAVGVGELRAGDGELA